MQHIWAKWETNPPPYATEIIGSWDDPPEKDGALHAEGGICKRGCCFVAPSGTLMPPIWWRTAGANHANK
jgi:hypothetical protein